MWTLKNSIIIVLLLFAAGLSGWSMLISKQPVSTVTSHLKQPDAFMENVVATIINKEGKPSLKIETPKMVHYAEDDTTDITTPHVTIFRHSPKPWYIDSDYAKTTQGISQIVFWSNVVIHHPSDSANPMTMMKTATLTIFPDKKIAETDQAVTLTQPDTTIHAIGMLTNLDDGTVKLLSEAKGEYVPST
ncbi:MAG TPA: LPS export ABC transporter periplasmic protein LptC [Gammaproteobacteria bacterium]|nr:LPS export ABC transporter periplasmic protein LptC [Gammaproteobacteria bacterium]